MNTGIWLAKKSYALCKFTGLFIMGSNLARTELVEASSHALWKDIHYDSHSLPQVWLYLSATVEWNMVEMELWLGSLKV